MNRAQVFKVMGKPGKETSRKKLGDNEIVVYVWENDDESYLRVSLLNNAVRGKVAERLSLHSGGWIPEESQTQSILSNHPILQQLEQFPQGMPRNEVEAIMGMPGERTTRSKRGTKTMDTYVWQNKYGPPLQITFADDFLDKITVNADKKKVTGQAR